MTDAAPSPFHAGERAIQTRLGVRDKLERFGRQVIRDHMPGQHRDFYRQLPFVLAGHADRHGWPWASILFNEAGFISSPDPRTLRIAAQPVAGDPLAVGLSTGTRLGLLGIELHSRRRNRLAAHITDISNTGIELAVDQAFGNCPQYIQARSAHFVAPRAQAASVVEDLDALPEAARTLIENADTFFVASYVADDSGAASDGVDVSHRGGRPGFVRVDDAQTLTVPDYLGNFHFNTLGNFLVTPRAGLLFIDFESGDMLTLTGRVQILWDDPDTEYFEGAERLWRFEMDHGHFIRNALPLRWSFDSYSPNTRLTGTWTDAEALRQANAARDAWRDYRVVRIEDESNVIRSFYLQPADGALPSFKAGQFLTLKLDTGDSTLVRTYTVSSAPADALYRISVKREPGAGSAFLHDRVRPGDTLQAKAPLGGFTFDASETRPAVLLSAGVGITPMVSMLRHAVHEAVRTRHMRRIEFIHSAGDAGQRAFFREVRQFVEQTGGHARYFSALGKVDNTLAPGRDYHHAGRVSKDFLQSVLPLDDYDYYLCGPAGFMQAMYDALRELGATDGRIYAEAFGPASLTRRPDPGGVAQPDIAQAAEAVVKFADAGFEQAWTPEAGTLLEFAEAHGLSPAYGCRNGQCGSCRTRLVSGRVAWRHAPQTTVEPGEVLLCCAVPAATEDGNVAQLTLSM